MARNKNKPGPEKKTTLTQGQLAALAAVVDAKGAAFITSSTKGWLIQRAWQFSSRLFTALQNKLPQNIQRAKLLTLKSKGKGSQGGSISKAVLLIPGQRKKEGLLFFGAKKNLSNRSKVKNLSLLLNLSVTTPSRTKKLIHGDLSNYRLYLSIVHDGFWDWDIPNGKVNYSPQLLEMMGYKPDDWSDSEKEWESRIHPEDKPKVGQALQAHFSKKTPFDMEYRLRTKSGEYRWFRDWGTAFFDEQGKPLRMIGAQVEVTPNKLKEQELEERVKLTNLNAEITTLLSLPDPLNQVLQQCLNLVQKVLELALVRIWLVDEHGNMEFAAGTGSLNENDLLLYRKIPTGRYLVGKVANQRTILTTDDLLNEPGFASQEWAKANRIKSFVGIPLMVGGNLLGVFGQFSSEPLNPTVTQALQTVSEILAQAIIRKRFEEERTRFSTLADNSEQFIAIADLQGKILSINPAGKKLAGLPANGPIPAWNEIFLFKTQHPFTSNEKRQYIRGPWQGEARLINPSTGEEIPLWVHLFYLRDNLTGEPTSMGILAQDIRERKKLEEELKRSRDFLDNLIENAPIPISVKDVKQGFRYILWNKASEQVSGLSAQDVLGKTVFDINPGLGSDLSHQTDLEVVKKKERVDMTDYPAIPPGGKISLILRIRKIPLLDSKGDTTHVLVISDDVTRERKVQKELEKAREEAQAASKAKTEFLANMSHEVRSPLGAMLGFTTMLGETTLDAMEKERLRQSILRNGHHLLNLLNDVLDLSKVESGKLDLDPVSSSPWNLLAESLAMVENQARQKGLSLSARTENEIPVQLVIDPTRFRQILVNLLSNAVKFTSKGKIEVRLGLHPWPVPAEGTLYLRLEVEDQGIGISKAQEARLFQPFTQADASTTRRFGGTGLGLSICKKIIDLMGGSIQVLSEEGLGSTFTVYFPIDRQFAKTTVGGLTLPQGKSLALPLLTRDSNSPLGGKILLADDSDEFRAIVSYFLQRAGAEVITARDGLEALALAEKNSFQVALIDMQMPNLDGLATVRQLRLGGFNGPVFAITANPLLGDEEQARQAGFNEYFRKPLDYELLIASIRGWMGNPDGNSRQESLGSPPDEKMASLTRQYIASLKEQVAPVYDWLQNGKQNEAENFAHRLRGTAAQYGLKNISAIAAQIEDSLLAKAPRELILPLALRLSEEVDRLAKSL